MRCCDLQKRDCRQGRDCPHRTSVPVWPWLVLLGLITLAYVLAPTVVALMDAPLVGSEW
jgi:hypothetical protein